MHVHSGSLVTLHADQARNAEDLEIRPAGSAPGRKRLNRAAGKPERQAPAAHTQSRRPVRSGPAAQREPAEHGMNPYARKALPFHGTPAYNAT